MADDYNMSVLSQAKHEYSIELVNILSPHILDGFKDMFKRAWKLCLKNDELDQYLMTFQSFLERVPHWNSTLIDEETKRIISESKCDYLDDLIACVSTAQLKIMTSVRVTNKRKKVDIEIPKVNKFIHNIYVKFARKLWDNAYLFENDIPSLTHQKNMRECEHICERCIMDAVRDSIPIENILKSYIDETVDVDVVEHIEEIELEPTEENDGDKEYKKSTDDNNNDKNDDKNDDNTDTDYKEALSEAVKDTKITKLNKTDSVSKQTDSVSKQTDSDVSKQQDVNIKLEISDNTKDKDIGNDEKNVIKINTAPTPHSTPILTPASPSKTPMTDINLEKTTALRFDDNDKVFDMGTNKESIVSAPKNIDRLEEISEMRNNQRKLEEALEDDDDEESLTISDEILPVSSLKIERL